MDIIYRKNRVRDWASEGLGSGQLNKALVHHKGEFYIASENTALEETLIFYSSPTGDIKNYCEVGGGKRITLDDVLSDFEAHLYDNLYYHLS